MNSEIHQTIKEILSLNQNHTGKAIQEMFDLLKNQRSREGCQNIQKAILFSMENIHEWENLVKYSEKWNMWEYRKGLIVRMRRRLRLNDDEKNITNSKEELEKLISLYSEIISPKKIQNSYKEINTSSSYTSPKHQEIEAIKNQNNHLQLPQGIQKPVKLYPKIDLSRIIKKNKLELDKEVNIFSQQKNDKKVQVKQINKKDQQRPVNSQRLCRIIKNKQKNEQLNPQGMNPTVKLNSNKKGDKRVSISKFTNSIKYDPSDLNARFNSFGKRHSNRFQGQNQIKNQPLKPIIVKAKQQANDCSQSYQMDSFDSFKNVTKENSEVDQCETKILIRKFSKQLKEEKESKESNQQCNLRQSSSKNKSLRQSFYASSDQKQDLYANLKKISQQITSNTMKFFYQCLQ